MWRKTLVLINFSLLLVACGTSSEAAPNPVTSSWQTYTSAEGEFSVAYPPDYTLYQHQVPSIDGVLADAPNAIALQRSSEPGFVLSIAYRPTGGALSAAELAALDDACVAGSSGQSLTLGGQAFQTLIFKDTPCGPHSSTLIYVNSGVMGYRIAIETQADYQSVAGDVNAILDTLLFRASNESAETALIPEAFCPLAESLTETDGKNSDDAISIAKEPDSAAGDTVEGCSAVPYR